MQKNERITALRGVFIMMIVLHHLSLYDGGGTLGVAFFFMLGGLTLSMGYYDKVCNPDFSYISFIKKRCDKFYPLHWLCLFVVLPLSLLPLVRGAVDAKTALAPLIPNVLLFQSLIPAQSFYFSFNAVSWYLSDTMIFGLLFPIIVKSLNKLSNAGKLLVLVIMLFVYSMLVYLLPVEYWHAILYISPLVRIVDFILGIYLYLLYKKLISHKVIDDYLEKHSKSLAGSMVLILIGVSCVSPSNVSLISAIYWPLLFILLIISILPPHNTYTLPPPRKPEKYTYAQQYAYYTNSLWRKMYNWVVGIGNISFSIFLIHQIIIRYVNSFFAFVGINSYPVRYIIILILIIAASWLCDKYFLRPVSLWLKERRN